MIVCCAITGARSESVEAFPPPCRCVLLQVMRYGRAQFEGAGRFTSALRLPSRCSTCKAYVVDLPCCVCPGGGITVLALHCMQGMSGGEMQQGHLCPRCSMLLGQEACLTHSRTTLACPIYLPYLQEISGGEVQQGHLCFFCGKDGSKACGRCRHATYCSAECQRAHWPEHKNKCVNL